MGNIIKFQELLYGALVLTAISIATRNGWALPTFSLSAIIFFFYLLDRWVEQDLTTYILGAHGTRIYYVVENIIQGLCRVLAISATFIFLGSKNASVADVGEEWQNIFAAIFRPSRAEDISLLYASYIYGMILLGLLLKDFNWISRPLVRGLFREILPIIIGLFAVSFFNPKGIKKIEKQLDKIEYKKKGNPNRRARRYK